MHALILRDFFFSDGVDCPFVSALVLPQRVFGDLGDSECCGIKGFLFLMHNVPNELLIHLTFGISTHT
jgi:hypothetical protein